MLQPPPRQPAVHGMSSKSKLNCNWHQIFGIPAQRAKLSLPHELFHCSQTLLLKTQILFACRCNLCRFPFLSATPKMPSVWDVGTGPGPGQQLLQISCLISTWDGLGCFCPSGNTELTEKKSQRKIRYKSHSLTLQVIPGHFHPLSPFPQDQAQP